MKWIAIMGALAMTVSATTESLVRSAAAADSVGDVVLAVHGGAGVTPRDKLSPEREKKIRAALDAALSAGEAVLKSPDGTSVDAVEAAIRVLEDSPLFNAGKGAAFTREGTNEMDASIMDGRTRAAGAVGDVTTIKNPISAARAVMEKSGHVLMVGEGAEAFAKQAGCEIVDPKYFWTERRWKLLQEELKKERDAEEKKSGAIGGERAGNLASQGHSSEARCGTVGAVALDRHGNLAAATSTGGLTMKRHGRVGDSPIVGAGNFADNKSCAVSGTGQGEYFIRAIAAYDIAALMEYKGLSVADAANEVVNRKIKEAGGEAGVIALDAKGNHAAPFNTNGMSRGYVTKDGKRHVAIYSE
ncbi:MAG: isoaspartyl peptidase/L-asparaginase [Pirellulales bacterium]